jgi:hypothetical protein
MTEATEPGTGSYNRSHVIRYRLPLRDDLSIAFRPDETQYHLSPNLGAPRAAVHSPSTSGCTGPGLGDRPHLELVAQDGLIPTEACGYDIGAACALLGGRLASECGPNVRAQRLPEVLSWPMRSPSSPRRGA